MSTTQQVLASEAGIEGAQSGATVAMFDAKGPVDGRASIRYRAAGAGSTQHILVDLPAGLGGKSHFSRVFRAFSVCFLEGEVRRGTP